MESGHKECKVKKTEKILLVRLDALGDTILTTPLIVELKRVYPGASLTVIATPRGAPSLESLPQIDRLMVFDSFSASLSQCAAFARSLKDQRFDLAVNVSEKIQAYLIPWIASVPVRLGFTPGWTQPLKALLCRLFLTHMTLYRNNPERSSGEHEVDRQMRLLRSINIDAQSGPLQLFPGKQDLQWAEEAVRAWGFNDYQALVVFHLSNKWNEEGYTPGVLAEIITESIAEHQDRAFILTYGEMERSWAEEFAGKFRSGRVHAFFDPSFMRWAALIQRAGVLVTMDTSASHVAAALGVPVVDVFPEKYYTHCTIALASLEIGVQACMQEVSGPHD